LPHISRQQALDKVNEYLKKVNQMQNISYVDGEDLREEMNVSIRSFIPNAFEDGKEKVKEFDDYVNRYVMALGHEKSAKEEQQDYMQRLLDAKKFLVVWKEELELIHDVQPLKGNEFKQSSKIFIVHGHDEQAKFELEIMLHRLKLEPIILHRQPDKGRTIIEKFEGESKSSDYAFVILTPDDDCLLLDKQTNKRKNVSRPRQNVLLELGFFIGSLGRHRVCTIYKEGVEIPSDIAGVLYKQFSKSVEELYGEIRKELITAGYRLPG
jgi:predicted nucleotide-binding protein